MGFRFYWQQSPPGRRTLAEIKQKLASAAAPEQASPAQAERPIASKRSKANRSEQAMAKQPEAGESQARQERGPKQAERPRMESEAILPAGIRILKGSVRDRDWRGVSKAIWLLEELESRLVEARKRRTQGAETCPPEA